MIKVSKQQKKIIQERQKLEQGIQNWVGENTHKPMPKIAQKLFLKAKYRMVAHSNRFATNGFTMSSLYLPFWYGVINFLLKIFRVEIRFSTGDQNQVLNAGIFHKGKYFDSYIKPEEKKND
jgi:hypothetical protein